MNVCAKVQGTAYWKAEQMLDYLKDSFLNQAGTRYFLNGKTLILMSNKTFAKRKTNLMNALAFFRPEIDLHMFLKSITIKPYIDGTLVHQKSIK